MKALDAGPSIFAQSLLRSVTVISLVSLVCVGATLWPFDVAQARTKPVIEMGDPDIGNDKPRPGPSGSGTAPTYTAVTISESFPRNTWEKRDLLRVTRYRLWSWLLLGR